jgi:SpoVK/Ycf46/Vps4 family AAA+-type ATPase
MAKRGQSRKQSGALDGFAERIERFSPLGTVAASRRQLELLQKISARASQKLQVNRAQGSDVKPARSRGPAALFVGSDGGAKTNAVAALGCELGLDAYRIDLRHVASKYIGETEKNLRRLFDAAGRCGAILFFDEADSLFGKRSQVKDSHDRYANLEIGYFLGRLENYDGLVILSAGSIEGLSEVLLKQVQTVVDFPAPSKTRKSA